jgi:hypothetical protein
LTLACSTDALADSWRILVAVFVAWVLPSRAKRIAPQPSMNPVIQRSWLPGPSLASRPGINAREYSLVFNWLYPDVFYALQASGNATLTLDKGAFRLNEVNPTLTNVSLLVASAGGPPPAGFVVSLATPGRPAARARRRRPLRTRRA